MCTSDIIIAGFADENRTAMKNFKSLGLTKIAFKPHFDDWIQHKESFKAFSEIAEKTVYGCYEGSGIIIDNGVLSEHGPMFKAELGKTIKEQ